MNEYMNEYIMIEQQNYNNRIISRYCFIATIKVYKCYSPQLPEYLKFFSHVLSYTHTHINHFISNCCAIKWMNGKQIRNMRLLHNSILELTQIIDKWKSLLNTPKNRTSCLNSLNFINNRGIPHMSYVTIPWCSNFLWKMLYAHVKISNKKI